MSSPTYESYVPKYVVEKISSNLIQSTPLVLEGSTTVFATLLFADISGFTRLASRLSAEDLKYYINDFFSIMLEVIESFAGDVLKFCGDAMIIMWHTTDKQAESRDICVLKAALCGLQLIESCGKYQKPWPENGSVAEFGNSLLYTQASGISSSATHTNTECHHCDAINLSLHCGLAAGPAHCMILGNDRHREFIVSGPLVEVMGKAEELADINEICVCSECKAVLEEYFYLDEVVDAISPGRFSRLRCKLKSDEHKGSQILLSNGGIFDGSFKVHIQSTAASVESLNRGHFLFPRFPVSVVNTNKPIGSIMYETDEMCVHGVVHIFSTSTNFITQKAVERNIDLPFDYRRLIETDRILQYESLLKSFIHQTAISALESHTYALLSEMRQIVTVFVSIHGLEDALNNGIYSQVQGMFLCLTDAIDLHNGSLRQFVVDDKGCIAIICFGLFGCNTTNNALNALHFAINFQQRCSQKNMTCYTGIASGRVYCGNVGNPMRCEFAVLGSSVNLAARLMSACASNCHCMLVTEEIRHSTSDCHEFIQVSSIAAKGYEQLVSVFSPIVTKHNFGRPIGGVAMNKTFQETINGPVNKFLRTLQELNESYVAQLSPESVDDVAFRTIGLESTDLSQGKFFPFEVEKQILSLKQQLGTSTKNDNAVVVFGERGSGKTCLLQRLCFDLLDQGWDNTKIIFVNVSNFANQKDQPYFLVRELFQRLIMDEQQQRSDIVISRFEAASLKVESASNSTSEVLIDLEEEDVISQQGLKCNSDSCIIHNTRNLSDRLTRRRTIQPSGSTANSFRRNVITDLIPPVFLRFKDLRIFTIIQSLFESHSESFYRFYDDMYNESKNNVHETLDHMPGDLSYASLNELLWEIFQCRSLIDFIKSFLNESLEWKTKYCDIVERIFICIIVVLFGIYPLSNDPTRRVIPRIIFLIDDFDSADSNSRRVFTEVIKLQKISPRFSALRSFIVMSCTVDASFDSLTMDEVPLDIQKISNSGSIDSITGVDRKHSFGSERINVHGNSKFIFHQKNLVSYVKMSNLSSNSIKGLLHNSLGDRRVDWLLRKEAGLLKHDSTVTFGRRHAFVLNQLDEHEIEITSFQEKKILLKTSKHLVSELHRVTRYGSPSLVYELLPALRHAIDHGTFTSISDLCLTKHHREKLLHWIDGLNGSELAILKAASVVECQFDVEIIRRGLMSLNMEYCCSDLILSAALLRLRRIGIFRQCCDEVRVTDCSFLCNSSTLDASINNMDGTLLSYEFCDHSIRLAIYNLMLESQKTAVHNAVALILEERVSSRSDRFYSWYPIFQHYMKSNTSDKMMEYSLKLLQYHIRAHRHRDVVQVCNKLLNLVGSSREKVLIKQASIGVDKLLQTLPNYEFKRRSEYPTMIKSLGSILSNASWDTQSKFDSFFSWTIRTPASYIFSRQLEITNKTATRRQTMSLRWSSLGWSNRVAADNGRDAEDLLKEVEYHSSLVNVFCKSLVAYQLFSRPILGRTRTTTSLIPIRCNFRSEILDISLLASIVEQLSNAYLCLGHASKSEDCSALALCLLQHADNKIKEDMMLKSLSVPRVQLGDKCSFVDHCHRKIDLNCKMRLAILGMFHGDIVSSVMLMDYVNDDSPMKSSLLSWCSRLCCGVDNMVPCNYQKNLESASVSTLDVESDGLEKGSLEDELQQEETNSLFVHLFNGLHAFSDLLFNTAILNLVESVKFCESLGNISLKIGASVFLTWCHILCGNFDAAEHIIQDLQSLLIVTDQSANFKAIDDVMLSKGCSSEIINLSHLLSMFKTAFFAPHVLGRCNFSNDVKCSSSLHDSSINLLNGCIGHHGWTTQCYDIFRIIMQPSSDLEEALITSKSTFPLIAYYCGGYPLECEANSQFKRPLLAFYFRYFGRPLPLFCESLQTINNCSSRGSFSPSAPHFHIIGFMALFACCRLLNQQIYMMNNTKERTDCSRDRRNSRLDDLHAMNFESMVTIMFGLSSLDRAVHSFPILRELSWVLHVQLQLLLHSVDDEYARTFLTDCMASRIVKFPENIQRKVQESRSMWTGMLCGTNPCKSSRINRSKALLSIDFLRHLGDFLDTNANKYHRCEDRKNSTENGILSTNSIWFGKWMIDWQYEELRQLIHGTDSSS